MKKDSPDPALKGKRIPLGEGIPLAEGIPLSIPHPL